MPGSRAVQNLQMPHPRDWHGGQMPRSGRGEGGGGWAQVELTDALLENKTNKPYNYLHCSVLSTVQRISHWSQILKWTKCFGYFFFPLPSNPQGNRFRLHDLTWKLTPKKNGLSSRIEKAYNLRLNSLITKLKYWIHELRRGSGSLRIGSIVRVRGKFWRRTSEHARRLRICEGSQSSLRISEISSSQRWTWLVKNQLNFQPISQLSNLPLTPNIRIQIFQISMKNWWREFDKDQSIFPWLIILLILTTFSVGYVLIFLWENRCWSVTLWA